MIAFGVQMEEFHDFVSSFMTTVIVSTTGIEDIYKKQHLINVFMASMWHWSLICVMFVVCLNLILCTLVDAYTGTVAARSKSDGPVPTLWGQTVDTTKHLSEYVFEVCKRVPKVGMQFTAASVRRATVSESPVAPDESPPHV
jgi:hypothetical protein